jgi:hypothetical protein
MENKDLTETEQQDTDPALERFKARFEEQLGMPLTSRLLGDRPLAPLFYDEDAEDPVMLGSRAAAETPFLIQVDIDQFTESAPLGYFAIGFWGHGTNSYAFYYCKVEPRLKVFFRLPYGGVYMDNAREAASIRRFLDTYFDFERDFLASADTDASMTAIESMGFGLYELLVRSGRRSASQSPFGDASSCQRCGRALADDELTCSNCGCMRLVSVTNDGRVRIRYQASLYEQPNLLERFASYL